MRENGLYIPALKALLINPDHLQITPRMAQALRHELRHAFMHAIQLGLGGVETDSCSVISPKLNHRTLQEQQRQLVKKFENGMMHTERLQKILSGKTRPNEKEKKLITKLNNSIQKMDLELYPVIYIVTANEKYNLHERISFRAPSGFQTTGRAEHIDFIGNDQYKVMCKEETIASDFLKKIIDNFLFHKQSSMYKFHNNIDVFLSEIDANLVGIFPLFIIEELFHEFYHEIYNFTQLIYSSLGAQQYRPLQGKYFSPQLIASFNVHNIQTDDFFYEALVNKIIKPSFLDAVPGMIKRFHKKNEINKCFFLLQTLIQHQRGDHDDFWAYRYKAVLHFSYNQYSLAAKMFKIVLKKKR